MSTETMQNKPRHELLRLENLARNEALLQKLLQPLNLPSVLASASSSLKRKAPASNKASKKRTATAPAASNSPAGSSEEDVTETDSGVRRSKRLKSKENKSPASTPKDSVKKPTIIEKAGPRENVFGPIAGIEVGKTWATRMACNTDGVHRPTVAGIHGKETEGCYSLALSGGYEDDVDLGNAFTYTGSGGRDLHGTKAKPKNLRTAPQSKDQTLTGGNKALMVSMETGKPVRVIRGPKAALGPARGYRYDGLYKVEKADYGKGLSGFMVWRFALTRLPGQEPLPEPGAHDLGDEEQNEVEAVNGFEMEKEE
ncbi:hypothetical protein HK097_002142 [Rhizophlyctis rosea]|uniref:YDG domain-containing protein n=1 Tax=Rhizophlyctis rosea TaxID=64517 RepID=A0AAD5S4M9_9FUNG|nr:hypothetical protein HK097_002142 [Rhizophlyctis rosea]